MTDLLYLYDFNLSLLRDNSSATQAKQFSREEPSYYSIKPSKTFNLSSTGYSTTTNINIVQDSFSDSGLELSIFSDSRIDNRAELAHDLCIPSKITKTLTDAQLILEAYKRWNVSCFDKLIGDFSVIIEDQEREQIVCARDIFGVKPLYYYYEGNIFIASSDVKSIVDNPKVKSIPNEGFIAELLSYNVSSISETIYSTIHRVPAAHYLILSHPNIRVQKFWDINFSHRIRYKDISEYSAHFYGVFEQAVQARLTGSSLPCSELSGGLDSSLIVGIANQILTSNGTQDRLKTFTLCFENLPFDETQYVEAFSDRWKNKSTYVDCDLLRNPDWRADVHNHYYLPHSPNQHMNSALLDKVSRKGHSLILSGIGGDEWFTGSRGYASFDILRHYCLTAFPHLFKEFQYQFASRRPSNARKKFILALLWPTIPATIKKLMCKIHSPAFPAWLPQQYIKKTCLRDRIHDADARYKTNNLSLSQAYYLTTTGVESYFLEDFHRFRKTFKLEPRYPFLDRRVVEFAFAIPEFVRNDKGWSKVVMRQAGKNILPKTILNRWDKAEFSYFFGRAFNSRQFNEQMRRPKISEFGWIDSDIFHQQLKLCQNAYRTNPCTNQPYTWHTWFAFAVETWLSVMYGAGKT